MKQLLIVRHAESDWDPELEDFNRPLNLNGNEDAVSMAKRLADKQILPELLVSSPALRAVSTAAIFAGAFKIGTEEISSVPGVYDASVNTLLHIISHFEDKYNCAALFGHNPGLSQLLSYLTNTGSYDLPPCGMALIEFPLQNWKLISGGTGDAVFFEYPQR